MSACLWLERPARWRAWGVALTLGLVLLPAVPLLTQALPAALGNSLAVALEAAGLAWLLGLPAGALAALYRFPGRRLLLALGPLPLLLPSFLWAIGWSNLAARLGPEGAALLCGQPACVLVFWASAFPLVLLTAYMAAASLSGSQVDAARLAGGERAVLWQVGRYVATPAALAAALAGVLTLSDPGPGFLFEVPTAAGEILTTFAVRYDFVLAGRRCAVLALLVLLLAAPLARAAAPRLAHEMFARPVQALQRVRRPGTGAAGSALALLVVALTAAPVLGLVLPVLREGAFAQAWRDVARTGGNTLLYAGGAAAVAMALGLALAVCVGRSERLRTVCLGVCLALVALPPALNALGVVQVAARAPACADPLLRSRLTVCVVLGLRFVPVAALLGLRAWGAMPASWALVAGLHGVPLGKYLHRVLFPYLLPAAGTSVLLVALLALADVGTVHLLAPPGESSLPLTIFTVMANTREARVASLCLVYVALAAGLLSVLWMLTRGGAR